MPKTKKAPARKVAKKSVRKLAEHEQLRDAIIEGMQEKKAKDIVWIDLRNLKNSVADFFVICHADSRTHIESIARSIEEFVYKKLGKSRFIPKDKQMRNGSCWIILPSSPTSSCRINVNSTGWNACGQMPISNASQVTIKPKHC